MLTPVEIARQAPQLSNPNLLINGDFQILQRTTATVTGAEVFIADRWKAAFAGGAVTPNRQTGGAGTRMDFVGGVATTYGWLRQRLERVLTERYTSGLTVTISCRVFSNNTVPRTISLSAQKPTSGVADDWLAGGTNFITGQAFLLPSDSAFHDYSSTLEIAYADLQYGLGFGVEFVDGIGSGEVISITDYKVEIGPVATPFQKRQPAEELALCQRYFEETYMAHDTNTAYVCSNWSVTKRTTPTISTTQVSGSGGTAIVAGGNSIYSYYQDGAPTALGTLLIKADAEL